MRHRMQVVLVATLTVSLMCFALGVYQKPAYAAGEQAVAGMPFAGQWAYNAVVSPPYNDGNSSHPSVHAKYYGDWATDVYSSSGTAVKLHVTAIGTVTFTKRQNNDTCSSYGANIAGRGIVLNVIVNGVTVGSIDFEHLDNISAGPYVNGMTIGTLTSESLNVNCYSVRHVHVEMKNETNYSCWADKGAPGTSLSESDPIGILGSTNTGTRETCGSVTPNQSPSVRTISTSDGHIQTFKISNGALSVNWYGPSDGMRGAWSQPVGLPAQAQGAPAVIQRPGQNVVDVFVRGGNNQVYTTWYNFQYGQWGGWIGMGGGPFSFTSNPQVVLGAYGNYQVFGTGGNVVEQNWYNPNSGNFGGWTTSPGLGAGAVGTPAPTLRPGQSIVDVFARGGSTNYIYATWYNYSTGQWGGWINLWGSLQNDPQVMPTSDGHVQVFGTGLNVIRQIWYDPWIGSYGAWTTSPGFGSNAIGIPAIVPRNGQNVIDAFVHASNNQVYTTWYNFQYGQWGGWIGMGGGPMSFMSDPQALATSDGNYQVFGTGGGVVEQNWFSPSSGNYGGWTTI